MPFRTLDAAQESDLIQEADVPNYDLDNDGEELYATLTGSSKTLWNYAKELFGLKALLGTKNRRHGFKKLSGDDLELAGLMDSNGTAVTGFSTDFLSSVQIGDMIAGNDKVFRSVANIISNTQIILDVPFPTNFVGSAIYRMQTLSERLNRIENNLKQVGELMFIRVKRATSIAFPYFNIGLADQDVLASNYPDYVSYLRNLLVEIDGVTNFNVIGYTGDGSNVTFSLQNSTQNQLLVNAMWQDAQFSGGFGNYKSIGVGSPIGSVPAGEYRITNVDTINVTISVASTITTGSGVGTMVIYHNRIANDTTKARHFSVNGRAIMGARTSKYFAGFRINDAIQDITVLQNAHNHTQNSHNHTQDSHNHTGGGGSATFVDDIRAGVNNNVNYVPAGYTGVFLDDGTTPFAPDGVSTRLSQRKSAISITGTNPVTATNQPATATNNSEIASNQSFSASGARTDIVTRPESLICEMYEYVGRYLP